MGRAGAATGPRATPGPGRGLACMRSCDPRAERDPRAPQWLFFAWWRWGGLLGCASIAISRPMTMRAARKFFLPPLRSPAPVRRPARLLRRATALGPGCRGPSAETRSSFRVSRSQLRHGRASDFFAPPRPALRAWPRLPTKRWPRSCDEACSPRVALEDHAGWPSKTSEHTWIPGNSRCNQRDGGNLQDVVAGGAPVPGAAMGWSVCTAWVPARIPRLASRSSPPAASQPARPRSACSDAS